MRVWRTSMISMVQLVRPALVFALIADAWLVVLLCSAETGDTGRTAAINAYPTWALLMLAAGLAGGVYVFGMALNDVFDIRRDRAFAPERPIASGRLRQNIAVAIGITALLFAIACAVPLGPASVLICLVCAAGVLFYDAAGKWLPAVGPINLGLVRAGLMFAVNPALSYGWPVALVLTHVVFTSAAIHRLQRKRPRLYGRALWGLVAGWAFWLLALISWTVIHKPALDNAAPRPWIGPILAGAAFLAFARWHAGRARTQRRAGEALMVYGTLWVIAYDAFWLAGAGLWWRAGTVAALLPLALAVRWLLDHAAVMGEGDAFPRWR